MNDFFVVLHVLHLLSTVPREIFFHKILWAKNDTPPKHFVAVHLAMVPMTMTDLVFLTTYIE